MKLKSQLRAMLWELWRTSQLELFARLGFQFLIVAIFAAILPGAGSPGESQLLVGILVIFLVASSVGSQTWLRELDRGRSGFSFRQGFVRPTPTWLLVLAPLAFCVATALLTYLYPIWVFWLFVETPVPVGGPCLFIATCVVCLVAATWSARTQVGKLLALFAVVVGFAAWIGCRVAGSPESALLTLGSIEFYRVLPGDVGLATVVVVVAVAALLAAVRRQRCGEGWAVSTPGRLPWRRERQASLIGIGAQSPLYSQFRCEASRCFPQVLTLSVVAPLLIGVFLSVVPALTPNWQYSPFVWAAALAICPMIYQIVGAEACLGLTYHRGSTTLSTFEATRPIRSDQLVLSKMLAIGSASMIGVLGLAIVAAVHTTVTGGWRDATDALASVRPLVAETSPASWARLLFCTVFIFTSSTATMLAGALWMPLYRKQFIAAFFVGLLAALLAVLDSKYDWPFETMWLVAGYAVAVATAATSAFAVLFAWRTRSLTLGYLCVALWLWGPYVATAVAEFRVVESQVYLPGVVLALGVSLLLLPLAAFAVAPLAVSAHRHR